MRGKSFFLHMIIPHKWVIFCGWKSYHEWAHNSGKFILSCCTVWSSIVGHYCRIWCRYNKEIMCIDPIKLYLQWGFKKPNLLDSRGSINNKTLQSTIATANTKVTRVAVAGAYNEAINVLHDKGSGHTRL